MIDPVSDPIWNGNGPNPTTATPSAKFEEFLPERARALVDPAHLRELIRSHPLSTTLGALALGYIIARTLRED